MTRISNSLPITIGQEFLQSHIDTGLFASRNMLYISGSIDGKLSIVAIGSLDDTHSLDLFRREFRYSLFLIADEPKSANPTAISEGDVFPVRLNFPARLLILDRAVVMLKFGIALLAWFVCFAILIKARNGEPRPISRDLTGLRIETSGKGKLFGKSRTQGSIAGHSCGYPACPSTNVGTYSE